MTTILFGIKDTQANLSFTKAKVFPNQLFLLSNPLFDDKVIIIKKSCINGNLNELFNISSSVLIEKSTQKHRIFSDKDEEQSKKIKLSASTSTFASTYTSTKSFDKKFGNILENMKKT